MAMAGEVTLAVKVVSACALVGSIRSSRVADCTWIITHTHTHTHTHTLHDHAASVILTDQHAGATEAVDVAAAQSASSS